jgi:DNA-binding transcriptional LysR family regulator
MLDEAEEADLAVSALLAKPRGTLRVGMPGAFIRSVLGPVLGEFLAAYPELRLNLRLIGGDASSHQRNVDLMVRPGPLEDSGLLVKAIMRIRLGVYASPLYLEHWGIPDSPAALRQQSCITTGCGIFGEPADSAIWRLRRGLELREVQVESRVAVPDPGINHQLAVAGVGIALIAFSAARADVERGRLIRFLPEWEPEPVVLYALYSARLETSPKVRVFLQFLRDRFGGESLLDVTAFTPKTGGSKLEEAMKRPA